MSRADANAEARLAVDVTRGLLLDLLATGDRRAVNAAAERFFARYDEMDDRERAKRGASEIRMDDRERAKRGASEIPMAVRPNRSRRPRRRAAR
jgi:hypothetical protein